MMPVLAALLLWAPAGLAAVDPPAGAAETAPAATPPADLLPMDAKLEAYEQFRALYDAARYAEALPFAQKVVELSEAGDDRERELPIAYNNLGATQLQSGDFAAAAASYQRSLELLEATQGISSRRLIVPLAGLGAAYAAQDQHGLAAEFFGRALAVSRRAEGLFNLAQLPLIEQSAASLHALTDYAGVERERLYALRIAEQNFGYGDPRTLPPLLALANFYEALQEYPAARAMYLRMRDITVEESGGFSPDAVRAMIGIARTHRLQLSTDPEATADLPLSARDEVAPDIAGSPFREPRPVATTLDRTGLKAAKSALEHLRAAADPPPQLMIDTLTELGDWYQSTSRPQLAMPYYREAADLFAANPGRGLVNPLLMPRLVYYRPPPSSRRGIQTPAGEYRTRHTVFEFTVTESGTPADITVIESDMSEGQLSQSRRALARAIYSPRFEDGKATASSGMRFTSEWTELLLPPPASEATQGADH